MALSDTTPLSGAQDDDESTVARPRQQRGRTALLPPAPLGLLGPLLPDGPLPPSQPRSFGTGPLNPAGLHLVHNRDGDRVRGQVTLDPHFEGDSGVVHGGIVALLLDDVMGAVVRVLQRRAVTAQLDVSYVAPVPVSRGLRLEAWLTSTEGRKFWIAGRVLDGDRPLALGRGLFLRVGQEHFERLGVSADPIPGEPAEAGRDAHDR